MGEFSRAQLASALAPNGRLRAAINIGNAALAQHGPSGAVEGISPAIANELGKALGLDVDFVLYASAGQLFDATDREEWDMAFLAVDAARTERLAFSVPYVAIEATFVVRDTDSFKSVKDVDRPDSLISVTDSAAYDLILTRTLRHAQIVRSKTPQETLAAFVSDGLTAAAGVRQPLEKFIVSNQGFRVLPDHFALIEQAIAVRRRDIGAMTPIDAELRSLIAGGFVRRTLDESGQTSLLVPTQVASA